ncbi:MAG: hypothetical protein IPM29_21640 [Planctomycetes bacterium]|nr:hypothetical protein [Planctomycetota bacterium]
MPRHSQRTLLTLAALCAACAAPLDRPWRGTVTTAGLYVDADAGTAGVRDLQGSAASTSASLTYAPGGGPIEFGPRIGVSSATVDEGSWASGTDVQSTSFVYGGVVRAWLGAPDAPVRGFVEGFAGGHATDLDVQVYDFPTSRVGDASDTGFHAGATAGVSTRVAGDAALLFGITWEHYRFAELDADADGFGVLLGFTGRF